MAPPMLPALRMVEDDASVRQAMEAQLIAARLRRLAVSDASQVDEIEDGFRPAIPDVRLGLDL